MKVIVFYVAMVATMLALAGNVIVQHCIVSNREDAARRELAVTMSLHQCAVEFAALRDILSGEPRDFSEYYKNLVRVKILQSAAKKALAHASNAELGGPEAVAARIAETGMQQEWMHYQTENHTLSHFTETERNAAYEKYAAQFNELDAPKLVTVQGSNRLLLWWFLFQVGAMPFMFLHYCIRIRANGMKVRYELLGNPMFPMWLLLWEVGLFRYPKKVHIREQVQRARAWAAFMLSSAIPCFAAGAGGKTCEKEPVRFSLTTATMSQYPGLEGAVFYPYPVQQSSFTASLPCGLFAGLWNSEPLSHRKVQPNSGTEVDAFLGWSGPVKGNTVTASGTYLDVSPDLRLPQGDVFQFSERVSRKLPLAKKLSASPYLWFREAFPVRGPKPIGGWFVHGGAILSGTIGKRFGNDLDLQIMRDSGAFGYNPGVFARVSETPSLKLGKHASLGIPTLFQQALSHTGDKRRKNVTTGLSLAYSF